MSDRIAIVGDVSPAPTDDELAAIVAALQWTWPRPVVLVDTSSRAVSSTNWRFSGRWWNNHPLTRRPRP